MQASKKKKKNVEKYWLFNPSRTHAWCFPSFRPTKNRKLGSNQAYTTLHHFVKRIQWKKLPVWTKWKGDTRLVAYSTDFGKHPIVCSHFLALLHHQRWDVSFSELPIRQCSYKSCTRYRFHFRHHFIRETSIVHVGPDGVQILSLSFAWYEYS